MNIQVDNMLYQKNREYDAMDPAERLEAKREELAELESKKPVVSFDDGLNFAVGAGLAHVIGREAMNMIPKKFISEPELQGRITTLTAHAIKAANTSGEAQKDALAVLSENGINAGAKAIKNLKGVNLESINDASAIGAAKEYMGKVIQNSSPYMNEFANKIHDHFPGGMKGVALTGTVLAGLAIVAAGREIDNRYKDAQVQNLKQDLTYAELVTLNRKVDQLSGERHI